MTIAWHECGDAFVTRDGRVFYAPICGGAFECSECGDLVGYCCGGCEDWDELSGKPDPRTICNECWVEHYG